MTVTQEGLDAIERCIEMSVECDDCQYKRDMRPACDTLAAIRAQLAAPQRPAEPPPGYVRVRAIVTVNKEGGYQIYGSSAGSLCLTGAWQRVKIIADIPLPIAEPIQASMEDVG